MPLGGERIGSAYVRIYGDGSSLSDDVRNSLRDAEPEIRASGRRLGDAYAEEFQGGLTRDDTRDFGHILRDNLERGIAESDLTNAYFESEDWKRFRGRLRDQFGEAGEVAGRRLQERFQEAGSGRGLSDAIRSIIPEVAAATAEIQRTEDHYLSDREEAYEENARRTAAIRDEEFTREARRLADLANMQDEAAREDRSRQERLARETMSIYRRQADERRRTLSTSRGDINDLNEALQRLSSGERRSTDSARNIATEITRIRTALSGVGGGSDRNDLLRDLNILQERLAEATPRADRFNAALLRLGDQVGDASGRGSRNNFVNVIGGAARGLTNLITLAPRAIADIGGKMAAAFQAAGGGLDGVRAGALELGKGLVGGAVAVATFGAVVTGLVFILGPVAALISGIVAALSALVATVSFGAVAGIVALAGAMVPLAAGIGVAVLAIKGMSDEMKARLAPAISDIKSAFGDLGKTAGDALGPGLEKALNGVAPVLRSLEPLVSKIGNALGDVAENFSSSLNSAGFREGIRALTEGPKDAVRQYDFLGNRIRDLGDSIINLGGGLGGIFLAARPLIREFTGYLQDLTQDFSDFANSTEGRSKIRAFLKDAADSAKSLGRFIGAAGETLVKFLDLGNESGDTIFDDLAKQFRGFTDYLDSHPGAVRDFFANGVDIARDLGNAVKFLVGLIGDLDTEESRQQLQEFFETLGDIGGAIRDVAPLFVDLANGLKFAYDAAIVTIDAYKLLAEVVQGVFTLDFSGTGDKFNALKDSATAAFGSDGGLASGASTADLLRGNMKTLQEAAGGGADRIRDLARQADALADSLTGASAATTELTRSQIGQNLSDANLADNASRLGVTTRDVIDASLGRAGAVKKVQAAIDNATGTEKKGADALAAFIGLQRETITEAQEQQRTTARYAQEYLSLAGLISEPLRAKLQSEGIEPTKRALAETIDKYKQLNTVANIKKLIAITGVPTTVAQLRKIIANLDDIDHKKPKPVVDAESRPLNVKIQAARKLLADLNAQKPTPKSDLQDSLLRQKIAAARQALANLNAQRPTPSVNLSTGGFNGAVESVKGMLRDLNGQVSTVYIDTVRRIRSEKEGALASGGTVPSTGLPYADRHPYMLADGEEVISNRYGQADRWRSLLKTINAGGTPTGLAAGGTATSGKTVDASGWQIVTPTADPSAVAAEVLARLNAAVSF